MEARITGECGHDDCSHYFYSATSEAVVEHWRDEHSWPVETSGSVVGDFRGEITEVRVYDKALAKDQLRILHRH